MYKKIKIDGVPEWAEIGEDIENCELGYKVLCTKDCDHEGYEPTDPGCWHIQANKPEGGE